VTNAMPRPKRRSFEAHHRDVGVTEAYEAKWLSSLPILVSFPPVNESCRGQVFP
jgi:hypothetical protein